MAFELSPGDQDIAEKLAIHDLGLSVTQGIGATVLIAGLKTPKGQLTVNRVLEGIGPTLRDEGIKLVVEEASGEGVVKLTKRIARGLGGTSALVVRAIKSKALWAKVIFLNTIRAAGVGVKAGQEEREAGGDIPQIIAGALVGFVTAITFLDLVLPEGEDISRRTAEGTLIIPGGLEGFATATSVTTVLAEAIRLVAFTDINLPGPIGGGGGGGF